MSKFLAIITFFIFCTDFFSQVKGDSVHVESTYAKKYTGTISKVDKEGYFIKTAYNREIFLSKLEIKTIKVVSELVDPNIDSKASTLFINSNDVNTDDTNARKENPRQTNLEELIKSLENIPVLERTSELSEFYMKYNLANFDISSFNSLEKSIDYRKFAKELSRHLYSKNLSLSFSEKVNFYKLLPSELEKYPNEDFVKYKKTKRRRSFIKFYGAAIIVSGGIGVLVGTIWTITNFELTGVGLSGLVSIKIGTIIKLLSNKPLYKSFLIYLKERNP